MKCRAPAYLRHSACVQAVSVAYPLTAYDRLVVSVLHSLLSVLSAWTAACACNTESISEGHQSIITFSVGPC